MTSKMVFKIAKQFIKRNAPSLLTGISVGCLVSAVVTAVPATVKAVRMVDICNATREEENKAILTKTEIVKISWRYYIPTALLTVASGVAAITANHINLLRIEALATAYALQTDKVKALKEKLQGKELEEERSSPIGFDDRPPWEDRTQPDATPVSQFDKVRCIETMTGRPFYSNRVDIERAINEFNRIAISEGSAYLSEFYELLGLEPCAIGDLMYVDVQHAGDQLRAEFRWEDYKGQPMLVVDTADSWTPNPFVECMRSQGRL